MTETCPFLRAIEPGNRADPYPLFAALGDAPTKLPDGRIVVSRYDDVLALLHDTRLSSAARSGGEEVAAAKRVDLLKLDPPEHDRIRRIMMRQFGPPHRPDLVSQLEPEIRRVTHELIDGFGIGEVELVGRFAHRLPLAIICRVMGVPVGDEGRFRDWVMAIVGGAGATDPSDEVRDAFRSLRSYLEGIAADRRGTASDDMLAGLANDRDGPDGELPQGSFGPMAVLLLIAGHETTANLISNGVQTLLRHPEEIERLRSEPGREHAVVEELLRLEPPVQMLSRVTLADVAVRGATIPAGRQVVLLLAGANRDPARFADANAFRPDRDDNQHLGFGSGIHACFGAPLARLEAQVALRSFFERVQRPRLMQPPQFRPSAVLRGPAVLRIGFDWIEPRPSART